MLPKTVKTKQTPNAQKQQDRLVSPSEDAVQEAHQNPEYRFAGIHVTTNRTLSVCANINGVTNSIFMLAKKQML